MVNKLNRNSEAYIKRSVCWWISPSGEWLSGSHMHTAKDILGSEFDLIYAYRKMWQRGYLRVVQLDGVLYYQRNPAIPLSTSQSETMTDYCQFHKIALEEDAI